MSTCHNLEFSLVEMSFKKAKELEFAFESDSYYAKVPLDKVISSMWETAKDMNSKYKETSEERFSMNVNISDC
jgi:L-serine dehydratase